MWHAATRELVAAGRLRVIGVVQEQHRERAALWLKWQGIGWPVAWDPFNQLEVKLVPKVLAVQPGGLVLKDRLHPKRIEGEGGLLEVMGRMQGATAELEQPAQFGPHLARARGPITPADEPGEFAPAAMATLLMDRQRLDAGSCNRRRAAVQALVDRARAPDATARDHFRAGVAQRLLLDLEGPSQRPGEQPNQGRFQGAINSWSRALSLDPGQYIWRRRIQQWGPRLDKPYPFYDWVPLARKELAARGLEPAAWKVLLSGSETARGGYDLPVPAVQENPDPLAQIPSDVKQRVSLHWAVAPHTGFAGPNVRVAPGTSRVHLSLVLAEDVRIEPEGGPLGIWIDLPDGWRARSSWIDLHPVGEEDYQDSRLDFELVAPAPGPPGEAPPPVPRLTGYVLYPVCVGENGVCNLLRRNFDLDLRPAR